MGFLLIGTLLAYQAIRHERKNLIDAALYIATLPMQLIARAGDAVSRWHAKTDKWGK